MRNARPTQASRLTLMPRPPPSSCPFKPCRPSACETGTATTSSDAGSGASESGTTGISFINCEMRFWRAASGSFSFNLSRMSLFATGNFSSTAAPPRQSARAFHWRSTLHSPFPVGGNAAAKYSLRQWDRQSAQPLFPLQINENLKYLPTINIGQ